MQTRPFRWVRHVISFACAIGLLLAGRWLFPSLPAHVATTTYYVNNQSGSNCSDTGAGTSQSAPWCDFTPVNSTTFGPGYQILLARGATWDQEMDIKGSGSASASATIDAYGTGVNPKIIRNGNASDLGIRMTDPSYWNVNDLEIGDAGTGILVYYDSLSHQELNFNNISVHDIYGIHQGGQGNGTCGSNKIWNSAGIDITGSVTFTSSQYALQNVSMNHITGTHNQDSVSFDWCNGHSLSASDGSDGSNLVQNVTLNHLNFSDDNADNDASVGCDEGLRLVNMTNATVLNSVLNDEGACHSSTGTAGIIYGRLENVTFVNGIMTNVPNTSSPDQTGFDYECCNDQVRVRASYIAGNAGPGIEFLAVHGSSDHSTNSEVSDNTFVSNGGESIARFGSNITPTGTISNNLYYEPARFTSGDFSGFTFSNNLAIGASGDISNAANGFSHRQGQNNWSYQYSSNGSSWTNLVYDNHQNEWVPAVGDSVPFVSQFEQHPDVCSSCWIGRAWTAPTSGTISIRGRVLKSDIGGGDGVVARITKNGTVIWGPQTIAYNDQVGVATDLNTITVARGDVIRFEIANNSNNEYDRTSWDPTVAYTSANTSAFNRYDDGSIPDHWVTTGSVTSGYHLETTLGYLYNSSQTRTQAVYGCQNGSDHFVSLTSNCEGHTVLRTEGWIYSSQPSGVTTTALYRCRDGEDDFVSIASNCEGYTVVSFLGYALSQP